jgi:alpha-ketoglutarate-dependent 2,4-dichlorophenoxyacetate dioxygenase
MPTATELHPLFAARIQGMDIGGQTDAAWIRDALDRWSVLVLPNQAITDASQIAFSEIFGPLETTGSGANGAGGKLIALTNIGPDGQIAPPTDKQVLNNTTNQFWHHDGSFTDSPARASILSAREVPPVGGDAAFCSTHAAWAAMPAAMRANVLDRIAIHDFGWSRGRVDPALITEAEKTSLPPVERAVVASESPNGKALYLGQHDLGQHDLGQHDPGQHDLAQHAKSNRGLNEADSRALIDDLMAFATNPAFVYAHRWQQDDIVIWDNQAVMYRATPFASTQERRCMVRTTTSCPPSVQ